MPTHQLDIKKLMDFPRINSLTKVRAKTGEIKDILEKALEKKGLNLAESAMLLTINDPSSLNSLFQTAGQVKQAIYGPRIVMFAPLYLSSFCVNDCAYCSFHARNHNQRKKLTMNQVKEQAKILQDMGHKRLLLEFGEHPRNNPIEYVVDVINTIYQTKKGRGEIRRVNVNIAATTVENYRLLKQAGIGTYQLFQETFHEPTYKLMHRGPKADFRRQLSAMFRAFAGGIDDLGIGVLFGLYDYRFEVLALVQYAKLMDKILGVGPHTISVPRFQPARTVNLKLKYQVKDRDFLKLIAILRLAVPYTGMIISTRETPEIRRQALAIGISQTSAASSTRPGGYSKTGDRSAAAQFQLNDHRSLDEVARDICRLGYLPSFCTACYRSQRTGQAFMKLAKTEEIHNLCQPNALLTFKEYLLDYATPATKQIGEQTIKNQLNLIKQQATRQKLSDYLKRLERGERDLYL